MVEMMTRAADVLAEDVLAEAELTGENINPL
jgi:hypothetical protein